MDNLDWMEASPMYVLTINDNAFGAVAVLDNAIMNDIAQEIERLKAAAN